MDIAGLAIPRLDADIAVAVASGLLVIVAGRVLERVAHARKPLEPALAPIENLAPSVAPIAAEPLSQQRASILGALHAITASCEESMRTQLATPPDDIRDGEIARICASALSSLRRRRPWLTPSTAETVDRVSGTRDELVALIQRNDEGERGDDPKQRQRINATIEILAKGITSLRERLESEFRASSGLFTPASKD